MRMMYIENIANAQKPPQPLLQKLEHQTYPSKYDPPKMHLYT